MARAFLKKKANNAPFTFQIETIRANVYGLLNLVDVCQQHSIHVTNYGTGCIYNYDAEHPEGMSAFTEDDVPNPPDSFYLNSKAVVDQLLQHYDNVLNLRVRMPISEDFFCERNLVTKLSTYSKVRWLKSLEMMTETHSTT